MQAEGVDGLSHMPEEWQSAIVPRESKRGKKLHKQLTRMARQLEQLATTGSHGRSLSNVKTALRNLMEKEIAAFFTSRYEMYESHLLADASSRSDSVTTPQPSEGRLPWPQKTSPLFKQIMFCLRDADNMFKASYNQRFRLRVLNSELSAWTEWVENQLPALMPDGTILSQSTSHLSELYPQAARVHSYYNKVFKQLARETKAEWHPSKLKKPFRILEKAFLEKAEKAFHAKYNNLFKRLVRQTKCKGPSSNLKTPFLALKKVFLNKAEQVYKAKSEQLGIVDAANFDIVEQEHVDEQKGDQEGAAPEQRSRMNFDCSRVFDIVRGTLVYNTLADAEGGLLRGVRAVFASDQFQVIRVKDRFSNPTSACWRDVLINGRMVSRDGTVQPHVVEVQFHQRDLREERTMVGGHFIYERHRALFEACELICGGKAGAKLQDLHSSAELTGAERRFVNTFHSAKTKGGNTGSPSSSPSAKVHPVSDDEYNKTS